MRGWLFSAILACDVGAPPGSSEPSPSSDPSPSSSSDAGSGPDWSEVAPILARCAGCHADGGIGFPITGYATAAALAPVIAEVVSSRRMPPWPAGPLSEPAFVGDPSLDEAEIATVVAWADAGAPL